ncbi:DUF317 domain-containing protein [Actinacidiphila oryziradicis]|uniref:DUF317 domain-containing protein n=1 Tax=Actinacidiphila oryziradicis TaxID=2571141 RepID=A0A4U0SHN0_9ACTN|nr:DUF317 domain-containing protein [Actinacidiphila oryziradicis]TKA08563.1 DUF317 domain-containing protein [Actinacidiphila oryziradicis]
MPRSLTVGQLVHQLQALDPELLARLAVNPDWPFSHFAGGVHEAGGISGPVAYITDDGQEDHLLPDVCRQLGWGPENWTTGLAPEAPAPDSDTTGDPWYLDGQDTGYIATELFHRPDWTIDDNDLPAVYTAPGGHLTVRCHDSGWSFEARRTLDGEEIWHADFDPTVPPAAIAAFTKALLNTEPAKT